MTMKMMGARSRQPRQRQAPSFLRSWSPIRTLNREGGQQSENGQGCYQQEADFTMCILSK